MSSSRTKNKKPTGQVRQSQVVTTFGPGSMFDLPNHSVIVGGLESWTKGDEVLEPRLVAKLEDLLQIRSLAPTLPRPTTKIRPRPGRRASPAGNFPNGSSPRGPWPRNPGINPLSPVDTPIVLVEGQVRRP